MVRPGLQSAPEPPALDSPPVSKRDAKLFRRDLTPGDLHLCPSQLKIGTSLTCALGTFISILILLRFSFASYELVRGRRTD